MEKTKVLLLLGIVFIIFMGVVGVVLFIALKKNPSATGAASAKEFSNAQDFLPFEDIKDGLIHLGDFEYRAILECQSINYDLKTNKEKEIIDASFQRFLNSLSFPITLHIQTKTVDNTTVLQKLEEDMVNTVEDYPHLYDYAVAYLDEMARITETIGNNKQKRKYIIIPYSEASTLTYSTDSEKYEEALRTMHIRCQLVMDGLSAMGVEAKQLTSVEIAELIYSTYHRDNYSDIDQILNGEYMSLIVEGENVLPKVTREDSLVWMISELENRLKVEINSQKIEELEKRKMLAVLDRVMQLKKAVTK